MEHVMDGKYVGRVAVFECGQCGHRVEVGPASMKITHWGDPGATHSGSATPEGVSLEATVEDGFDVDAFLVSLGLNPGIDDD